MLIHWEVVQFKLALGIDGQPAKKQYFLDHIVKRICVNLDILNKMPVNYKTIVYITECVGNF